LTLIVYGLSFVILLVMLSPAALYAINTFAEADQVQ